MKRIILILLMLLFACIPLTGLASEPPVLADEQLVRTLLPDHTLKRGVMSGSDRMLLLMRSPEDELVFVGAVYQDGAWHLTTSTPLPEGTILGVENFTHSLGIPNTTGEGYPYFTVSLAALDATHWRVSSFYPPGDQVREFSLGPNWIALGSARDGYILGSHPWSDITTIDWTTLPADYESAAAQVDHDGWAMVNNPDPKDRLHLRAAPSRQAASYGKYYSGTPVRVLEQKGDWAKVRIGGREGWMMAEYLAFDDDMALVEIAAPWLMLLTGADASLYADYEDAVPCGTLTEDVVYYVIGVLGDDWYHLWFYYTDEYAYIRQNALWEGNG